jgi:hypothetical protein
MGGGDHLSAKAAFWLRLAAFPHAEHVDGEHGFASICKPAGEAVAIIGKGRVPVMAAIPAAMDRKYQMQLAFGHVAGPVKRGGNLALLLQSCNRGYI